MKYIDNFLKEKVSLLTMDRLIKLVTWNLNWVKYFYAKVQLTVLNLTLRLYFNISWYAILNI